MFTMFQEKKNSHTTHPYLIDTVQHFKQTIDSGKKVHPLTRLEWMFYDIFRVQKWF